MAKMKKRSMTRTVWTLSALAGGAIALACGSSADVADGDGNLGNNAGENGNGASGSGAASGTGAGSFGASTGSGGKGSGSGTSSGGTNGEGGVDYGGGNYPNIDFDYDPNFGGAPSCASTVGEPGEIKRPIDIIFVIDNSGSMTEEIQEVEQNIYQNFATIIEDSDIDYRVILVSRYGDSGTNGITNSDTNFGVCIPSPFGVQKSANPYTNDCSDPLNTPLRDPAAQPADRRFFHYSADIESLDALCVLLDSYARPDEFNDDVTTDNGPAGSAYRNWIKQAPNGWKAFLRADAFKVFVAITDDDVQCNTNEFDNKGTNSGVTFGNLALNDLNTAAGGDDVATKWDTALRALSTTDFGTAANRNYVFHSIVGLEENNPATTAWPSTAAIQTTKCEEDNNATPDGVGTGYQALSKLTGGLRYPICSENGTNFDPVFNAIAQGVIDSAKVPCEYDFPAVTGTIDPAAIKVNYTPGGGGAVQTLTRVNNQGACAGNAFYFDDNANPTKVFLCPNSCSTVQSDAQAKLQLDFGCLGS